MAARADRLSERVGLYAVTGSGGLSGLLAFVAYFLVLIPVLVAALNALQVDAITAPASDMLAQFLNAIPSLFMALVILGIAL